MSIDVLREVLNHSQAKGTDRNVLVALADSANVFGISWLPLDPPRRAKADPTKCVTHRANCSKREAIRAVQALERMGEIQVQKAQRGQRRISVYWVSVGTFAQVEIAYDDLPFDLVSPFVRGARLSPRTDLFDVTSRGDGPVTPRGDELAPDGVTALRAGGEEHPSVEPPLDPSEHPAADPRDLSEALPAAPPPALEQVQDRESAAASESEPVSIERAVASLAKLEGWDTGSLAVVMPLLNQLPEAVFADTLRKTIARRGDNPPGLLVFLLRTAIGDWRKGQNDARLATWDQFFGEAGLERIKRDDPDRYVLAWATPSLEAVRPLPPALVVEHVLEYVFEHTVDHAERDRLLKVFIEATDRIPSVRAVNDWILGALDRKRRPLDEVLATIDSFCQGATDQERAELHAFANEIHANILKDAERRRVA